MDTTKQLTVCGLRSGGYSVDDCALLIGAIYTARRTKNRVFNGCSTDLRRCDGFCAVKRKTRFFNLI